MHKTADPVKEQKLENVLKWRNRRLTFAEIGHELGVTRARAQMVYKEAVEHKAELENPSWDCGLSNRAKHVLAACELSSKEAVAKAIEDGWLRPHGATPNGLTIYSYGKKTHSEVCKWAGVEFKLSSLRLAEVKQRVKWLENVLKLNGICPRCGIEEIAHSCGAKL